MNNVELDRYYEDTFSLVRTMIIKTEAIAERDNQVLQAAGYPVTSDKTKWRYYMNLAGDYHPTDEPMKIFSIDTGEEIIFNKENLSQHLATFREYSKGGDWYNRLVQVYQHQSTLINGILAPIPYAETIAARDYKILRYNKNLVLWNEDQLIPKLQRFVDSDVRHLFKNDYITTDDLFLPLMMQQLRADIIKTIHAIRIEDCYTRHTHDFFIWSHIDSFGEFSVYKNSLSREQVMWLFRNIAYIKNNAGQQFTFNKLVENLLTKANIPLAKYDMVENTETQIEDLTPTPLYRKLMLNLVEDYGRAASFIDTEELVLKQRNLAKDNLNHGAIYYEDSLTKGKHSLHSEVPTKVLESSMKDYTNRHADTLMSVVFNEWIYLAGNGIYRGQIIVNDPKTGRQSRLPVTDAYHVWKYLVEYSKGNRLEEVNLVRYNNVMKLKPPSINAIFQIAGKDFIDGKITHDIRNLWFPASTFISPDYLIQYSVEVYATMWKHKKLYSQFYRLNKRARIKNATKMIYDSGVVKLGEHTSYRDLLEQYEFYFDDYTPEEAKNFAWDIFKRMTGWDANTQPSTRVKQNDLIEIMTRLSSYTIQIIKQIDDGTGQVELPNETFIDDPRLVNGGNGLFGDYSNVPLNTRTNFDLIGKLTAKIEMYTPEKPVLKVEMSHKARFCSNNHFRLKNILNDPFDYSVKVTNHEYFRLKDEYDPGEPTILPPTNYGLVSGPSNMVFLPKTNYGSLRGDT